MKLEIGKEYVTRSGLKVKIYDIAEAGNYPVIAGIFKGKLIEPYSYTKGGSNGIGSILQSDIVGEWKEPLDFDWSCLPTWCNKYIAMEGSGIWYAYSDAPGQGRYGFWGSNFCKISKEYAPKNFKGTWGKSLFKNPNINLPCK